MEIKKREILTRLKVTAYLAQKKFWNYALIKALVFIGFLIISLGNFLGAKDLISDGWESIFANFTHKYEYESLTKVNVGSNLDFITNHFGPPRLLKQSKFYKNLTFAYYLEDKFILTLVLDGNRVSAFTITALEQDFIPQIIGRKDIDNENNKILDNFDEKAEYAVDSINVNFFLVEEELGKDKLFLNSFAGVIGYRKNKNSKLKEIYNLVIQEIKGSELDERIDDFMQNTENNFFGIGEVELPAIADSILTNYEYSLYY